MAIVSTNSNVSRYGRPVLAWGVALLFFFPIFWMVLTSFKTDADAVKPEFLIWFTPTLDNYLNLTENYDYWRFAQLVITTVCATLFTLVVGIPAAYAMAFNPSRAAGYLDVDVIHKMLPLPQSVPNDFLAKGIGLYDTRSGDYGCEFN